MRYLVFIFALVAATPPALACSVCGVYGEDVSNKPFLQGTALLSLTPLIFIGGAVNYIYRRYKQAARLSDAAEAATLNSLEPAPQLAAEQL